MTVTFIATGVSAAGFETTVSELLSYAYAGDSFVFSISALVSDLVSSLSAFDMNSGALL